MAVIRFDANVPVELALKFDSGKQVQSRIPDAPDQMMYTICGDDTIYVPLNVAAQITKLGVRKMELISICKRQTNGVTRWEVKRVGDTVTPQIAEPPTMLENQLVRSIDEAKQQKAQRASSSPDTPAAPTSANAQVVQQPSNITALTTVGQTGLSLLLAGCMTAAIDGVVLARDYAHSKGLTLALSEESIQDLATSLLIHVQRMAELECKYDIKANAATNRMAQSGGVAWRR